MESTRKDVLIDKMLNNPLEFRDAEMQELLNFFVSGELDFDDLRTCVKRIFNQNESSLLTASDAASGTMGWANKKSSAKRSGRFFKRIRKGQRDGKRIVVLAEGDSWFQFPFFIDDIIDHLSRKDDLLVHSLAYGGDWITNIIYEGKYIEELSVLKPDVFLVSGGGNDLVGSNRVAVMVDPDKKSTPKYEYLETIQNLDPRVKADWVFEAQHYIKKDFFAFLHVIYAQYWIIMHSLQRSRDFCYMPVISQGYDYAIPRWRNDKGRSLKQKLVNGLVGSGKWLHQPMMMKGITDAALQQKIIYTFIFEFNELFAKLAETCENFYHVDCRDVAQGKTEFWYDELHLKSEVYGRVADKFHFLIREAKKVADHKISGAESAVPKVSKVLRVVD